jgi:signal transduction histidine kinase
VSLIKSIVKEKSLRMLIGVALVPSLVLPLVILFVFHPMLERHLTSYMEKDAIALANHLWSELSFKVDNPNLILTERESVLLENQTEQFNLYKVRLFNRSGKMIFSTLKSERNSQGDAQFISKLIESNGVYSKVIQKNGLTRDLQEFKLDVVEVYVPLSGSQSIVIELYYDISSRLSDLHSIQDKISTITIVGAFFYFLLVLFSLSKSSIIMSKNNLLIREVEEKMKEIEVVNDELSQFAYVVSHDLKAPLRAIGSLSQWVHDDYVELLDEEGKENLSLIVSRSKRMQSMIDAILEYSRVGRIQESFEQVSISSLLVEIIDLLSIPETIKITVTSEMPTIRGEKIRFQQLFQNILSNAIKFMDKEQGIIKVNARKQASMWLFSVEDNGPGIPEKDKEGVFKIFKTLQSRDRHESTGVGLSIVKKIVDCYGGEIWVEEADPFGSKFCFSLPVTKNDDEGEL